jgi:hypothetical protein
VQRTKEYIEGREATENFERGMKALFQVPKSAVLPKKATKQSTTLRKTKQADKTRRGFAFPPSLSVRGAAIGLCLLVRSK